MDHGHVCVDAFGYPKMTKMSIHEVGTEGKGKGVKQIDETSKGVAPGVYGWEVAKVVEGGKERTLRGGRVVK